MQRGQEPAAGSDAEHPLPSQEGRQRRYKPFRAQHWDEIRVISNPRYKTSELSGDQWRHSKMIQLVRKGHIVYESDDFSLLDSLQKNISSKLEEQAKKELGNEAWEELADGLPGQACDQEGCTAEPTNTYRMKAHFDQESGKWYAADPEIDQYHFCDAHSRRGDQDMDDCDDNYEVISGLGPQDPDPERVAVAGQAFVNPDASHSSEEFEDLSPGKPAETEIPVQRRGKRDRNEEEEEEDDNDEAEDPFDEFLSRLAQQQQQQKQQQTKKKPGSQKKGLTPEQLVALAKLLDEPEGGSRKQQRQEPPVNRKQIARMLFNDLVSRHQDDADDAGGEGEGEAEEFA